MSYSSLPAFKLFQLTSLSCALALAGCGGGDGVDSLPPPIDSEGPVVKPDPSDPGNPNPDVNPDFFLQELTVSPPSIELSSEPITFTVTVKAVAKNGFSIVGNENVELKILSGENDGALTIEGKPGKTTNEKGEAIYEIKLNPQSIINETELLKNGFEFEASAISKGVAITQLGQVRFYKDGSGGSSSDKKSTIELDTKLESTTLSSSALNASGDKAILTVTAVNENGVRAKNVTTQLTLVPIKGVPLTAVSIIDNSKKTDSSGMASFEIIIDPNLTSDERDKLLQGITYYINITEEVTGATKKEIRMLPVEIPESDYKLSIGGNTAKLNAYGGEEGGRQKLTIKATAINDKVPTTIGGAKVTVALNGNVKGVTLSSEDLTLDAKGEAKVDLIVAEGLSDIDRNTLKTEGISYTVTLLEPNRSKTSEEFESSVYIPKQQYKINNAGSDKQVLYSSGGEAKFTFRVNKISGGAVTGQEVAVELPSNLVNAGVLTLNGPSEQKTNGQGEVSFTVKVPANLTEGQKVQLEDALGFAIIAKIKEPLGIVSEIESNRIKLASDFTKSDIRLTSDTSPSTITPFDKTFILRIAAKRTDGSAADNKKVRLVLNDVTGIRVIGNQQTTNDFGVAEFTLQIDQNLTQAQRDALIGSGISYTAVLTDTDGVQAKISSTVQVNKPATAFQFGTMTAQPISELGDSSNVNVQILSKSGSNQSVKDQSVAIELGSNAKRYGVTVTSSTEKTDFEGNAIFVVKVPEGLSAIERKALKSGGIKYQLSYVENGITYSSTEQSIPFKNLSVDLTILNAPNFINNRPFYTLNGEGDTSVIQARLSTQMTSFNIAGQPIELEFADKELSALLNVNGKLGSATNIVSTNTDGTVSFTVVVPNNLTQDEKNKLKNKKLTATLTETLTGKKQEIQFNIQSTKAAIDLIPITPKPLNLNGGEIQIEVIAKDSKDNVIAGQKVFLALPAAIASQGVVLATSGTQTTNDSGKATYTIAVPNNLTDEQKKAIGNSFAVVFSAADANGNIATRVSQVSTVNNGTKENISIVASKVVNSKGDKFKVFVRLANNKGTIAGRTVRLNVNDADKIGVTVAKQAIKTNNVGVATFELTLKPGANVDQALLESGIKVTATTTTSESTQLIQDYIVSVDTAAVDSYQILASSDKSTLNTGGDQTNATFRVTDGSGGILAGVPVQLSITNLEASGAALTTPSMVTTDTSGKIDVGVLLAASSINARLNHNIDIEAKIVIPTYDANGDVSLDGGERKTLSLSATGTTINMSALATQLKVGETTVITATLIDGSGRAIANADMELVDDTDANIVDSVQTDADGIATFTVSEDNSYFDANGNLRVYARAIGENKLNTQRSLTSINLVKVSQAGISFIDISDVYDVDLPKTINVQIRTDTPEQAQELVRKASRVEIQTTLGSFINNDVIITETIRGSNRKGNIITIPVVLTSKLAGTTVLQATVLGEMANGVLKYQTTVDARFRATTPAQMLFQAVKSVITPGSSTEVVARVKDKNDVPVEGQTVVFSRTADSSAGRLSAATAVTDSKGEARVVYLANASSPIGGVVINANLLQDPSGIGTKTTTITVSKEAVYTTLAFSNKLSSDNIYYTVQGSISVMDGSGRAVANKEVSIKSYATQYAQGKVCLLDSTVSYQERDEQVAVPGENGQPDTVKNVPQKPKVKSEQVAILIESNWKATEDGNYNYTLDKNEDGNVNGQLDAINPVAIIGGTVSDDGYTFVTNSEGRSDFSIRYPIRYSNWVKVRFDATTFLNGSENLQSINYQLPREESDISIVNSTLVTPWIDDMSPFGDGSAICVKSMTVNINQQVNNTEVSLVSASDEKQTYTASINGQTEIDDGNRKPFYSFSFNQAFDLGSSITINSNGNKFDRIVKVD